MPSEKSKITLNQKYRPALTCALIVDTPVIILALDVRAATGDAHQTLADLAAPAILVSSAERLADTGAVASLVAQAIRTRRADGRANAGDAGRARSAVPISLADRAR